MTEVLAAAAVFCIASLFVMLGLGGGLAVLLASRVGARLMIGRVKPSWIHREYAALLILLAAILMWEAFSG